MELPPRSGARWAQASRPRRPRRRRGPGVPPRARRRADGVRQDAPVAARGVLHAPRRPGCAGSPSPAWSRVPEVLAVSDGDDDEPPFLVLGWIEQGHPRPTTEADLGRALAALHRATPPTLRARGPPLDRQPRPAERALRHVGRVLRDPAPGAARPSRPRRRARCPTRAIAALERLDADRLREVGGPAEPPARLHGDLWAGNRLVDVDGRSWLIDPAAHGGHREFDLAMMRLFGGFGADCFAAYEEVHPLARRVGGARRAPPDRAARRPRHQVRRRLRRARPADAIARYA